MRVLRLLPLAICLLLAGAKLFAQENVPTQATQPHPQATVPPSATPTEPGTGNSRVAPASKSPKPVQGPDVRLDSKPHTDLDNSVDSSMLEPDLGMGATPIVDLGHDILPVTPAGMLSRSETDNPRMVYFALPHRSGDGISAGDSAIIAARQADLVRAAAFRGFDLKRAGWLYQQGVCPVLQPDAEQVAGIPAAGGGEGFILLHFVKQEEGRSSAFTAIVPRESGFPVRAITVAHRSVEDQHEFLSEKTSGAVVNEALPASTLYKNLQPVQDWIATSACIAEMGGAYPHIPNEPYLSEDIITAPPPLIRLLISGDRKITFTDRVDDTHYVVWDEHVSNHGRMLDAQHEHVTIVPRPVTNPPVPQPRLIANIPQPPIRVTPDPPSPLSGNKQ